MCGYPFRKASDMWSLGCILAQTERRDFLDAWVSADAAKTERAASFVSYVGFCEEALSKRFCVDNRRESWQQMRRLGQWDTQAGPARGRGFGKALRPAYFSAFHGEVVELSSRRPGNSGEFIKAPLVANPRHPPAIGSHALDQPRPSRRMEPWGGALALQRLAIGISPTPPLAT